MSQRVYLKPLLLFGTDHAISFSPSKARFGLKRENVTVLKNGYIVVEFIPMAKSGRAAGKSDPKTNFMKFSEKQSFLLTGLQGAEILSIDHKLRPEFRLNYSFKREEVAKSLSFKPLWPEKKIEVNFRQENATGKTAFTSLLPVSDFLLVQRMIDYSLPYVMGWHGLDSVRLMEEGDLIEASHI
jgi:hypothetical protein